MWRRLLRHVHPDQGGDHDLFIWTNSIMELVAGDGLEPLPREAKRDPPRHPSTGERLDYMEAFNRADSFDGLTRAAVMYAEELPEPYASLLRMLRDCQEVGPDDIALHRQQNQGATYRTLAAIGHRAKMSGEERTRWYRI